MRSGKGRTGVLLRRLFCKLVDLLMLERRSID